MKTHKFILLSVLIFLSLTAIAQDNIVQDSELAEAEFHTAINPTNNANIVVVTMHGFEDVTDSYFSIYFTKDFGVSWKKSEFQGMHQGHDGTGDPVIAFNSNGELNLVHLIVTEEGVIRTVVSTSYDSGETWSLEYVYDQEYFTDKPWITIDNSTSSPYEGNIYVPTVANDVQLLCLDEEHTLIYNQPIPGGNHIPSVVTNKAGDVFVSSMEWSDPIEMYINKYTDGGATLEHSTFVTSFPDYTFSLSDISFRFQPAPYIAIDNSDGPYSGRIYMSYTGSEDIDPEYFNVFLTYSDDDGLTWSMPKIIHSDTSDSIQQFYSSIYVNNEGVLLLDWYDRSNYDNSNQNTDFFIGISFDGGDSFSQLQLNSESMDFAVAAEAGFGFGVGEYHQLVATNETAISFWSDGRNNDGDLNIYFSKVNIENVSVGVEEHSIINDKISISNIYPQPVTDNINISLQLKQAFKLKFSILNVDGQVIKEDLWEPYNSGKHNVEIPISLSPGEYILRTTSDKGFFKNQKFIVVK